MKLLNIVGRLCAYCAAIGLGLIIILGAFLIFGLLMEWLVEGFLYAQSVPIQTIGWFFGYIAGVAQFVSWIRKNKMVKKFLHELKSNRKEVRA